MDSPRHDFPPTMRLGVLGQEPVQPQPVRRSGSTSVGHHRSKSHAAQDDLITGATLLNTALDAHALVAVLDPHGRFLTVNDKFCTLAKYSRSELLGQSHRIIISRDQRSLILDLQRSIMLGHVWQGELEARAKDGSRVWVAATIIPSLDARGEARPIVAILADLTHQKRLERELDAKRRLQGLLATISGIFSGISSSEVDEAIEGAQRLIVNALALDRCVLWRNDEAARAMRCTHSWQRPGGPAIPQGFTTHRHLPWVYRHLMRGNALAFVALAELPPEASRDAATYRKFGTVSSLTIPLIANQRVFGALSFATLSAERSWREEELAELKLIAQIIGNVVGRQRAELREEQLRIELAHAMRVASLGELAAALAHELSQPLAAILSNAQAARRLVEQTEITPEELHAILDDIARDDKRAGNVIRNLTAMVSKRPTVRERCSLNELVHEVLDLIKAELIAEHVPVRLALAAGLPPVQVARVELQQVLLNLLINAIHAMAETPLPARVLEIQSCAEGQEIFLRVRDRGHGIPKDRVSKIFEPFVSTKPAGLGMGLSICRRIIVDHGGQIEARSHGPGGATFSFSLPVGSAPA